LDFDTLLKTKYNLILRPKQREAVLNINGPALLMAGPGGGKTTVVALRCANMVLCCGIAAENILTLTYSQSTKKDTEKRYCNIFGRESLGNLRFTTMQGLCRLIVREHANLTGATPPKLVEDGKRRILHGIHTESNTGEVLTDSILEDLIISVSLVKNGILTADTVENGSHPSKNFNKIFTAYEAYMLANNCMDFDDMQARVLAAFDERPDLLESLKAQYRYINVDEAQEMTKLQHAIIKKLAAPDNNLFMAADEDQCLNLGRAASLESLRDFSRVFPEARMIRMDRSFRSTHAIVNAAGSLIKHNSARPRTSMNTGNEIGMPVEETVLSDNSMLGSHIVSQLKAIPNPEDSAILYRKNNSAAVIADALDREGIPFRMREQASSYFDHWVIKDILAFLAIGHDPSDAVSMKRVYRKLSASISADAFSKATALVGDGNNQNMFDAILSIPGISEGASLRLKRLKDDFANLQGMKPGNAVKCILENMEYGEYLKKACGDGLYLENLLQTVESITTIASRTDGYPELLERITDLKNIMGKADENDETIAVTLSPVHLVKGEEFRNVFIVDLVEGNFPTLGAIAESNGESSKLLEEERRLFYVAVTRACKFTELVYANRINGKRVTPSRFIRELLPIAKPRKAAGRAANPSLSSRKQPSAEKKPAARKPAVSIALQKPPSFEQFNMEIGMKVEHKAFGLGIVSAFDLAHDIVAVRFQKDGVKKFAASFCMSGGVLKKASEEIVEPSDSLDIDTENANVSLVL
jgi:DNA helicase II / ATP-dependent DNA helicase PcrA